MTKVKAASPQRIEKARVSSPYGHGIDRVTRVVDTLMVMARRKQLTERQLHAGQKYLACYEVIYGQLGGASDYDRTRMRGSLGNPPPQAYMEASGTISLVKQVLYPKDYAVVHRVCVGGLSLDECALQLYGVNDRAGREQAGRRLREGLRELADRWYPDEKVVRVRAFRTERARATNAETVEPGTVYRTDS